MEHKQHSIWERDITHEVVGALAVFALVISSLVTGLGVAALGVQAQVAFAQHEGTMNLTAAAFLGDDRPTASFRAASSTPPAIARPALASSTAMYCPKIVKTVAFGRHEATTTGDVGELQRFIANHFNLEASSTVSGYFGSTTASYLERFQKEQGIPPSPSVGPLTRAAILKLCAGASAKMREMHPPSTDSTENHRVGSTTPPTLPMPTTRPRGEMMPPKAVQEAQPVTMHDSQGASNSASVAEAIAEISDGYNKLTGALLSLIGL